MTEAVGRRGIWRWGGLVIVLASVISLAGAVHYEHGWAAFGLAWLGVGLALLASVIYRPEQADRG